METASGQFQHGIDGGLSGRGQDALINIRTRNQHTDHTGTDQSGNHQRTYRPKHLSNTSNYVGFADDADFRNLLIRSSQNARLEGVILKTMPPILPSDNPCIQDTTQADSCHTGIRDRHCVENEGTAGCD
jgi:hypothetical protein